MNCILLLLAITSSCQLAVGAFGPDSATEALLDRAQQASSAQEDRLIEDVEIRGYRRVSREAIVNSMKSRPGDRYNEGQVRKDFEAILALGAFDPMQSKLVTNRGPRDGVVLVLFVKEYPVIRDLQFQGLKSVGEEEVLARLKEEKIDLNKGSFCTSEKVKAASIAIQKLLAERGHPDVRVSVDVREILIATVDVILKFDQ